MELENIVANTVYIKAREGELIMCCAYWCMFLAFWRKLDSTREKHHFLFLFYSLAAQSLFLKCHCLKCCNSKALLALYILTTREILSVYEMYQPFHSWWSMQSRHPVVVRCLLLMFHSHTIVAFMLYFAGCCSWPLANKVKVNFHCTQYILHVTCTQVLNECHDCCDSSSSSTGPGTAIGLFAVSNLVGHLGTIAMIACHACIVKTYSSMIMITYTLHCKN